LFLDFGCADSNLGKHCNSLILDVIDLLIFLSLLVLLPFENIFLSVVKIDFAQVREDVEHLSVQRDHDEVKESRLALSYVKLLSITKV